MTGQHRGKRVPWQARLACWAYGHIPIRINAHTYLCDRCEQVASTPVELP